MARLPSGGLRWRMETPAEIRERWRYLRDLLIEQLSRFESGELHIHSNAEDVSVAAIGKLKQNIADFDSMIFRSETRDP